MTHKEAVNKIISDTMNISIIKQSIHINARTTFSRSGGPGGQNVNKVNTKVTLRIFLNDIAGLSDKEMERVKIILANRITSEGEIIITSDEERTQRTNLERAYSRLEHLILSVAKFPKQRHPTRPGKATIEKRLCNKKRQARKKADRSSRPDND